MTSWQQACTKANSLCQSEAWTSHVIHFLSPSLPLPQAESLVHQTTGMSLISRWNCSSFRWRVVKGGGRGKNGDTRLRLVLCGQRSRALSNFGEKDAAKCRNAPGKLLKWLAPLHRSCQPLLGVNLSPEFVNLYFPYAGQGLLFFAGGSGILNSNRHMWQRKEEAMLCKIHMRDFKSHFQQDCLAYCTKPVSEHLAIACVS